ncbi:hypothetical protein HY492_03870 [Candidatus Woesearchaeota archaeon]|nr:hypothetical protein [Candidatus Woesearchaeota archaeon]
MPEPTLSYRSTGDQIVSFTVLYKDVYSWGTLYKLMHEWLLENRYCSPNDEEFREILYEHIERSWGSEVFTRWRLSKTDLKSFKGLYRYDLDVDVHILGQKEVEVVTNGKKMKADKGEVEVAIKGYLIEDPDGKVKKHWLGQHFSDFIFKVFLKKVRRNHEIALYFDAQRFQEAVKNYLKLDTYLPEKEAQEFFPKRDLT